MTEATALRLVKHSLSIAGHRTSVSLENAFWEALSAIAARQHLPVAALVARIDGERGDANLSSAIRVFLLEAALAGSSTPPVEPAA